MRTVIQWWQRRVDERRAIRMNEILTYLQLNPGLHGGLELCKAVGRRSGTIYPTLWRLEKKGWITAEWVDQPDNRPRRRFYRAAS